jgi:hypothetical protein
MVASKLRSSVISEGRDIEGVRVEVTIELRKGRWWVR